MKKTQRELTQWAIDQIKRHYKDDIALLIAISGHALENDCHGECFDYFIPVNDNGYKLSQTFIIDGVGHDLYPRSWERMENMAQFDDEFAYGLGEAQILYARSEADRTQFEALRQKQKDNMADQGFMYKKALEKLDGAMEIYRTMMFEDQLYKVKMGAGFIAHYLALAIAYVNGTYFKQRLDADSIEIAKMSKVPDNFVAYYEGIVKAKSVSELKTISHMIISTTRQLMQSLKPAIKAVDSELNYHYLGNWYEEMSLTCRRIYYHCDANDYMRVYPDALNMQNELNVIQEEFALKEMDLLGAFDVNDLMTFKKRVKEIEDMIIHEIESHGVALNKYDTLEQFLEKNDK